MAVPTDADGVLELIEGLESNRLPSNARVNSEVQLGPIPFILFYNTTIDILEGVNYVNGSGSPNADVDAGLEALRALQGTSVYTAGVQQKGPRGSDVGAYKTLMIFFVAVGSLIGYGPLSTNIAAAKADIDALDSSDAFVNGTEVKGEITEPGFREVMTDLMTQMHAQI